MSKLRLSFACVGLLGLIAACSTPSDDGGADASETSGDGDGDATGDGDGAPGDGDGDGAPGDGDGAPGDGDGEPGEAPPQPDWLTVYTTGNPDDADVVPQGPGLLLMGGGLDVDAAFEWQASLIAGGDVVVIRASGSDGYNDYLYSDIGGIDSVQTIIADSLDAAQDPWVAWTIAHAEAVFMAGGDQADYYEFWQGTELAAAVTTVWNRGGVIGGTSAGLAVMGDYLFTALNGTVYPDEVLTDPYNQYMTLANDFFEFPPLAGVFTDSHFAERDRMGRLLGFTARVIEDGWASEAIGLGVDERTAMVIGPDGVGEVLGIGGVFILRADQAAAACSPGMQLEYGPLAVHKLVAGDTATWPGGVTDVPAAEVTASGGVTIPANPY